MSRDLTPRAIVKLLDKYIVGQDAAKRSVAISLRNRWRRSQVTGDIKQEIAPNNIILIGPTGVGKTEIARRLAVLADAPFIKVEASKYTEVGYVGRDVESMVRELLDIAINRINQKMAQSIAGKAIEIARHKVLDLLLPPPVKNYSDAGGKEKYQNTLEHYQHSRAKMAELLDAGKLEKREIDVEVSPAPGAQVEIFSNIGMENMDVNFNDILASFMPKRNVKQSRKMAIPEALKYFTSEESAKLVDKPKVIEAAKIAVQENGIIFIDEIDKIASSDKKSGADISRTGVQRDLLPIVEGSNVPTKHGIINTAHILFISAGAFHVAKPSDLIPELQGRFPIRVELHSLTKDDFVKILKFPQNALTKQYQAIFASEKVELSFTQNAIEAIASYAQLANEKMQDIGARRLHTILNTLLEEYLFMMPQKQLKNVKVTKILVDQKLRNIIEDEDLSRYIL